MSWIKKCLKKVLISSFIFDFINDIIFRHNTKTSISQIKKLLWTELFLNLNLLIDNEGVSTMQSNHPMISSKAKSAFLKYESINFININSKTISPINKNFSSK